MTTSLIFHIWFQDKKDDDKAKDKKSDDKSKDKKGDKKDADKKEETPEETPDLSSQQGIPFFSK